MILRPAPFGTWSGYDWGPTKKEGSGGKYAIIASSLFDDQKCCSKAPQPIIRNGDMSQPDSEVELFKDVVTIKKNACPHARRWPYYYNLIGSVAGVGVMYSGEWRAEAHVVEGGLAADLLDGAGGEDAHVPGFVVGP